MSISLKSAELCRFTLVVGLIPRVFKTQILDSSETFY